MNRFVQQRTEFEREPKDHQLKAEDHAVSGFRSINRSINRKDLQLHFSPGSLVLFEFEDH